MLNWIWLGLVVLAVALGALTGQLDAVTNAAFTACKTAVMDLALPLAGIMAFWLGMMRIAEKAGLVAILAKALRPIMRRLFPEVPTNHPAMGSMVMNMAANMLGLSNAATPLGLRAMQDLEKLNTRPGTATNAMCTFLAINTSSIQLIPATTVALLAAAGSKEPTAIIGTSFIATICSTAVAIIAVKFFEKLPMFALPPATPVPASQTAGGSPESSGEGDSPAPMVPMQGWAKALLAVMSFIFAITFVLMAFFPEYFQTFVSQIRGALAFPGNFTLGGAWVAKPWYERAIATISLLAIPMIVVVFPLYAAGRLVPVYEEFVEGAKEGFQVAIRIIPYLVAILVAVAMFRAAGGIDLLSRPLAFVLTPLGFPSELLPMVFMRPLSGTGTTALFAELIRPDAYGPDSLIARMGGTIMGSTETTFYVLAVYFGSVAIRRTRHAVAAGLTADLAGVVAAVVVCNIVFR
ncbi:nucleoside recognition protein [Spartobacteria bacterium LR76]|nr:nucleoside recognition protein [Spartobacteria bacterium LR76]